MSILYGLLRTQVAREDGQALVEYGLILALVALVAIIGVAAMGSDVSGMYRSGQGRGNRHGGRRRRLVEKSQLN